MAPALVLGFHDEILTQRMGSVMSQVTATTAAKSLWQLLIIQYLEDPLSSLILTQDSELRSWRMNNPNQVKAWITWSDLTAHPHDDLEILSNLSSPVILWTWQAQKTRNNFD